MNHRGRARPASSFSVEEGAWADGFDRCHSACKSWRRRKPTPHIGDRGLFCLLWREICHSTFSDFCNNIGTKCECRLGAFMTVIEWTPDPKWTQALRP